MVCSYCQYNIRKPHTLLCNHTFCRECVLHHISHNICHGFKRFQCIQCRRPYNYVCNGSSFGLKTNNGILWSVSVTGKISNASIWHRSSKTGRLLRRRFSHVLPAICF